MNLNQDDLQAIRQVFQEEINTQVRPIVQEEIKTQVRSIVQEELEPVKKDIKKLRKDTKYIIGALDKELMHQAKRVDRIEHHLHLTPLSD